jgi:hypothetical protein
MVKEVHWTIIDLDNLENYPWIFTLLILRLQIKSPNV